MGNTNDQALLSAGVMSGTEPPSEGRRYARNVATTRLTPKSSYGGIRDNALTSSHHNHQLKVGGSLLPDSNSSER